MSSGYDSNILKHKNMMEEILEETSRRGSKGKKIKEMSKN